MNGLFLVLEPTALHQQNFDKILKLFQSMMPWRGPLFVTWRGIDLVSATSLGIPFSRKSFQRRWVWLLKRTKHRYCTHVPTYFCYFKYLYFRVSRWNYLSIFSAIFVRFCLHLFDQFQYFISLKPYWFMKSSN